jgi:dTDP-4-amino-4,6-dideoxygalactose transaminase
MTYVRNSDLNERLTAMTDFGFMGERTSAICGGNYRISDYAVAIGLAAVEALSTRMARLRGAAGACRRRLLGKKSRLESGVGETWMSMTINLTAPAGEAHSTTERCDAGGVEWRRRHPAFTDVRRADLSVTDALAVRVTGLPFHDELTEAEIDRVVACLQ